jgi:hypothetical protein
MYQIHFFNNPPQQPACILISFLSFGQDITQSVTGRVKDITSGAALVSASVSVFEKDKLI